MSVYRIDTVTTNLISYLSLALYWSSYYLINILDVRSLICPRGVSMSRYQKRKVFYLYEPLGLQVIKVSAPFVCGELAQCDLPLVSP